MRKCPKCGTTYSDSDLRTMCSSCLVNLERVDEASAMTEMETPGPISLGQITPPGTAPGELPALPEVTLPPAPPPVMPEIALPASPEPLLPEPAPVPEAPAPAGLVIPEPPQAPDFAALRNLYVSTKDDASLTPDTLAAAELEATAPVPPPVATPPAAYAAPDAPPMMGPDEVALPPGPVAFELPGANATPPPLVSAPPPPATARPIEKDWGSEAVDAPTITAQPLDQNAMLTAKTRSGGFVFLAILCGIITLFTLFGTSPADFSFFTLVLVSVLVIGVIVFLRKAIYYSAIDTVTLKPQYQPVLGAMLPLQVAVDVLKDIPVTDVEVTLTAQERAIDRGSKSDTTHQHIIYTQTARIPAGGQWTGGQSMFFTANLAIPAELPPSFTGKHNFIEWSAALWVGIPGWYPDIRQKLPLTVRPLVAGAPLPAIEPRAFSLPELPGLTAYLALSCAMKDGWPLLQAGSEVPFTLAITTKDGASNERLRVELAYHITGSGDHEDRNIAAVTCFPGGWSAGTQDYTDTLRIPADVPVSYEGHHLRIRWTLTVRHEVAWQLDKVQVFNLTMVPAPVSMAAFQAPPKTERGKW
jgi:hypothetical protein